MCVIFIAENRRPTEDMVEKAFDHNDSGAGIAYRDSGYVKWEKGLDLAKIQDLVRKAPLPFIAHFRIPSEGGKRASLCHPFPIEKTVPLDLMGRTKGYVLFHNGHWGEWRNQMFRILEKFPNSKLPPGKWSDTRGMAWFAAYYGIHSLELINEKAVAFGPTEDALEVTGTGWSQLEGEKGLWVSNKLWEYQSHNSFNGGYSNLKPYCMAISCTSKELIGNTKRCAKHQLNGPREQTVLPGETDSEEESGVVISTESKTIESEVVPEGVASVADAGPAGGRPTESPFERNFRMALRLRRDHKMTKECYKQARKIYEKWLMQQPTGHPNILREPPERIH